MPADTMELAYGVIGELGADVADIRIPGEKQRQLHLPGADLLVLAGLTVVSAFFRGLFTGITEEAGKTGEDLGRGLVRRFTGLLGRLGHGDHDAGAAAPVSANGDVPVADAAGGGDDAGDGDVLDEFRQAAADAEVALTRLGAAAGALEKYAAGAQAEVESALRGLGLRDERVKAIAPAATTRLISQVNDDIAGG
jgi:hypothetical protein